MILWFLDRFGLPGSYYKIWLRLLHEQRIKPSDVRTVSLHKLMPKRQLLTSYGTRKAPTWVPELGPEIIGVIDASIETLKPSAVVLAAPESLACLGLHPEHATLNNLRGSVYWRSGIPHLVVLPMSAWTAMVTQKEIGGANYGFESADDFEEGRQGTIHLEGDSSKQNERDQFKFPSQRGKSQHAKADTRSTRDSQSLEQRSATTINECDNGEGSTPSGSAETQSNQFLDQNGGNSLPARATVRRWSPHQPSPSGEFETDFDRLGVQGNRIRPVHGHVHETNSGLRGDASTRSATTPSTDIRTGDEKFERDRVEPRTGSATSDSNSIDDGNLPGVVDGRFGGGHELESTFSAQIEYDEADEDPDKDNFFYEPVLSPTGRFAITADVGKLYRVIQDGKNSKGLEAPITLRYR